jgi:hypothetical protein
MASLTQSAVTITDSWIEPVGGGQLRVVQATVVLTGQGDATDTIPASLFGLAAIVDCTPLINSADTLIVTASPSYDKTILLLKAAGSAAPANATNGTYKLTIRGKY